RRTAATGANLFRRVMGPPNVRETTGLFYPQSTASANPRQLLPGEHVEQAAGAERALQRHQPALVVEDAADEAGVRARLVAAQDLQGLLGVALRNERREAA